MSQRPTPDETRKRRRWIALGGIGLILAVAIGGVLWWLSGDAPEEATIEGALGALSDETTTNTPQTDAPATTSADTTTSTPEPDAPATTAGGIDGTWAVDTSIGDFAFEEATASFVGFRIDEELAGIGQAEAVGRTPEVSGTLEIDGTAVTDVTVEAQMDAIVTNDSRRDRRAREAINVSEFPTAQFVLTEPIELEDVPTEGETITATAAGELTIAGVTNPVEFEIEAQLQDGLVLVVGRTSIVFADYDVSVPSAPLVLSVADNGIVELQLWFSPV